LDELKDFVTRDTKRLLIVEDDPAHLQLLRDTLGEAEDVRIEIASDGSSGLALMRKECFDCVVANPRAAHARDLTLVLGPERPVDGQPFTLIIHGDASAENAAWDQLAKTDNRVRRVHSLERLLDQTTLSLHRNVAHMPVVQQQVLRDIYESSKPVVGKK